MWPPSSALAAFARTTIASAFQRTSAPRRASRSRLPGKGACAASEIVFRYGVFSTCGSGTRRLRACCSSCLSTNVARSGPPAAITASSASSHSCVSCGSPSSSGSRQEALGISLARSSRFTEAPWRRAGRRGLSARERRRRRWDNAAMDTLTITRPDDWHLHLRDGAALAAVLPHTARQFARAIVMPNLKPPVTTTALALAYRDRILAARPAGSDFKPLMTLYLTDNTSPDEVERAKGSGAVHGVKLYPAGATTNSDSGVTDVRRCAPALEAMQREGVALLVHGEVTHGEVDVFDRERVFLDK